MLFFEVLLTVTGIYLLIKNEVRKNISRRKELKRVKSDGEILNNTYIMEHERKIEDDMMYEEYLEWCKIKGELPANKKGFDEHRFKEWKLQEKIKKTLQ